MFDVPTICMWKMILRRIYVLLLFLQNIYILRIALGSLQLSYIFILMTKWRNDDNTLPITQLKIAGGLWPRKWKKNTE